jgi:AAA domain
MPLFEVRLRGRRMSPAPHPDFDLTEALPWEPTSDGGDPYEYVPPPTDEDAPDRHRDLELLDESWTPIDLADVLSGTTTQPEPTILARADLRSLLYPGTVNGVHSDSGVGKGWVACLAIVQEIALGHDVMLIDTEDTAQSIVARLRLLGATDDRIARYLIYLRPQTEFGYLAVDRLLEIVAARHVTFVVIDSLGECFGLEAINEDRDAEVGPWLRRVARRLAEAGPAVLTVDHATKAADNPLHPSGSKRKRAAIGGASYLVTATTPLVAGKGGRLRLTCAKDRHGTWARGEHVADLVMTALEPDLMTPAGSMRVDLYAPDPHDADEAAELPVLLAARDAVRQAKKAETALTLRTLIGLMTTKARKDILYGGVDLAVTRGALTETTGPRNARMLSYESDLP